MSHCRPICKIKTPLLFCSPSKFRTSSVSSSISSRYLLGGGEFLPPHQKWKFPAGDARKICSTSIIDCRRLNVIGECVLISISRSVSFGATENAGVENVARSKMQGGKRESVKRGTRCQGWKTRKLPFLRMRTKIWRKNNNENFGTDYRKSMSLKTTVTTDLRSEVEIMPFLRMCKENEPTLL